MIKYITGDIRDSSVFARSSKIFNYNMQNKFVNSKYRYRESNLYL